MATPQDNLQILPKDAELPTGAYYAADLSLVLPPREWGSLVYGPFSSGVSNIMAVYAGMPFFAWASRSGDGSYPVYMGTHYCGDVDTETGILCLVSAEAFPGPVPKGVVSYWSVAAAPSAENGDATHGKFEVITSGSVGGDRDTQVISSDSEN